MGLFSKKRSSSTSSSPKLSPKLDSRSSRSTLESPRTPSFPKPTAHLPPAPNPNTDPEGYLTSLQAVRERSQLVYDRVRKDQGKCFTFDASKMDGVIRYVVGIIKVFYIGNCSG
jgi:hypothetical protein